MRFPPFLYSFPFPYDVPLFSKNNGVRLLIKSGISETKETRKVIGVE